MSTREASRLTWYFDYVSPFSYLQLATHPDLFRRDQVVLKPVVFGGVLANWSHKGPAELPPKRTFSYRYVLFRARELGVALRFPPAHPFNPLQALRLTVGLGSKIDVVQTIFDFVWKEGRSLGDGWRVLCERLGVTDADALCNAPEVKAELRANGDSASAAGVFGVPTFEVDGELFWGVDATSMLRAYLADRELFSDPEMYRVTHLPAAVQRKL
ncbi:MAG: 2-hydroxychromene-2-carboxylate isomerase [Betaproteobacteria bacterium]|jgi:2-hydroxychromene-2-carboxylate isomerase|nr:2-hydroxychromene-2-carboxylate isomerase [Betaproteobacteria bacterium]